MDYNIKEIIELISDNENLECQADEQDYLNYNYEHEDNVEDEHDESEVRKIFNFVNNSEEIHCRTIALEIDLADIVNISEISANPIQSCWPTQCNEETHQITDEIQQKECAFCFTKFMHPKELDSHILREHSGFKPYKCQVCQRIFQGNNQHSCYGVQPVNNKEDPLPFKVAGTSLKTPAQLSTNPQNNERRTQRTFECNICATLFSTELYLKNHMLDHKVICEYCGCYFNSYKEIKTHIHCHDGPYDCDGCEKSFLSKFDLHRHKDRVQHTSILANTSATSIPCLICEKSFRHEVSLKRHSYIHEIVALYHCEKCDEIFPKKSALKAHMVLHI